MDTEPDSASGCCRAVKAFSHYTVLGHLGSGGMGEVCLAHDTSLDRKVALKFLPEATQRDTTAQRRFLAEAKAAAAIDHPYVCKIYEIGEVEGKAFIAMEYVEGETLKQRLSRAQLPLKLTLQITLEIGEAVAKGHELGIVHRDLKPANIMITLDGHTKVMDFGLAKRMLTSVGDTTLSSILTLPGAVVGTLGYMSPEQLRGQPVDHRADIFALGVVFYEMLTGIHPFGKQVPMEIAAAILRETPAPLSRYLKNCPESLEHIGKRLLGKGLGDRYQSVREVLLDLRNLQEESASALPQSRPMSISIAVLPFVNLSSARENEYFSDGITEDIIAQLSKIAGLQVIARTSVMRYKNADKDLAQIGHELGVNTLLEGSVRREGNRVRIVGSLVDVETQRELWAETYDRDMDDVLAVQSEVSQHIATTLKAGLPSAELQHIQLGRVEDIEAYHLYLKGRYFLNKLTSEGIRKAIRHFQGALDKDPNYARSYAGISTCYANSGHFNYVPPSEAFPKAKAAAIKALELDNSLAEAHVSIALVEVFFSWDWAAAEQSFRRAIELNPNFAEAHIYYSWYLVIVNRLEEALAEAERVVDLDPLSPFATTNLGWVLSMIDHLDAAIEQFNKTLEIDPSFLPVKTCLAFAYMGKRMYREAIECLQDWTWSRCILGEAYALAGQDEAARQLLAEITRFSQKEIHRPSEIAWLCIILGEREQASEWLEKAFRKRDYTLSMHARARGAQWDRFRTDPLVLEFMKRMGLEVQMHPRT
jgi:eukaryotic-like serine/threonine-protein kinase